MPVMMMTMKEQETRTRVTGYPVLHAVDSDLPSLSVLNDSVSLAGHDPLDPHAHLVCDPVIESEPNASASLQGRPIDGV